MIRNLLTGLGVLAIVLALGAAFIAIGHLLSAAWAAVIATAYLLFLGSLLVLGILKSRADRADTEEADRC